MFYEVENMTAGLVGYDSIRKQGKYDCGADKCLLNKEILSVKSRCVHRYKGAEGTILVGEHYER